MTVRLKAKLEHLDGHIELVDMELPSEKHADVIIAGWRHWEKEHPGFKVHSLQLVKDWK